MIYRFIMLSDENDFFRREIKIDSEATFLELNDHILMSVGYDKSELTTFHICDEDWQKEQEVTLMDMGLGSEFDTYLMESTKLDDLLEYKGQRLLFVFDMLSERAFFIELTEIIPGENLDKPKTIQTEGKAPVQHSSPEFAETRIIAKGDSELSEDLFVSDEELDLSDLDPEGFDGLNAPDLDSVY